MSVKLQEGRGLASVSTVRDWSQEPQPSNIESVNLGNGIVNVTLDASTGGVSAFRIRCSHSLITISLTYTPILPPHIRGRDAQADHPSAPFPLLHLALKIQCGHWPSRNFDSSAL